MGIQDIIDGKRKWRAHKSRVRALPGDYQIAYREMEKYLLHVGPVDFEEGSSALSQIVDLFEEGAAAGRSVLEVTGEDVAAFCDGLIEGTTTYGELCQERVEREISAAMKKSMGRKKDS